MASPKSIASSGTAAGAFVDDRNNVLANGYLMLTPNFTAGTLSGGGIVSNTAVKVSLDANGIPSSGQTMFCSDQFSSPTTPTFRVRVFNSNDSFVADLGNCVISGTAPVDLTALAATSNGVSYNSAVLTNPSGNQTIATGNLTLTTGQFVETANPVTGSGNLVRQTSPTLTTPNIGAATATSINKVTITAPATAATLTLINNTTITGPAATGTLARTSGDTLTSTTLTSPVINGSPTGTGIPTVTLKKGSGGGSYSSASTSFVQVDGTNLTYTVTIPTGWKLMVTASFRVGTSTAAVACNVGIADGGTVVVETVQQTTAAGVLTSSALAWAITGDGNSHTVDLRYKTSNGADSVSIGNSSSTDVPTMVFLLTPSN